MNYLQLFCKMSLNPAELYGINAGKLAENGPADLILIDKDAVATVGDYASRSSNSPFTGWELQGVVRKTVCAGKVIYSTAE